MRALIFEPEEVPGSGALDLAGRPMLVRQLQWLRELGIEDVVVEVTSGPAACELAEILLGDEPLVARCTIVPTAAAVGLDALAERAGLEHDELFLALPANLAVEARFALPSESVRYAIAPPAFAAHTESATIAIRTAQSPAQVEPVPQSGWALPLHNRSEAHALSCAALAGQVPGLLVHAAEVRPGIWYARGARVAEGATLIAPVLVGSEARVFGRARVGPNVLLGKAAVIEREVVLSEVTVASGTLIGEGSRIRQAHVDPRGMTSLSDGSRIEISDPLLLSSTLSRGTSPSSRVLAALLALLLLGPWALVALGASLFGKRATRKLSWHGGSLWLGTFGLAALDVVPALYDVVRGRRDLVGVASPTALELASAQGAELSRAGAFDISSALAPGASPPTLLALWRWYQQNKSGTLDRQLIAARLQRAPK